MIWRRKCGSTIITTIIIWSLSRLDCSLDLLNSGVSLNCSSCIHIVRLWKIRVRRPWTACHFLWRLLCCVKTYLSSSSLGLRISRWTTPDDPCMMTAWYVKFCIHSHWKPSECSMVPTLTVVIVVGTTIAAVLVIWLPLQGLVVLCRMPSRTCPSSCFLRCYILTILDYVHYNLGLILYIVRAPVIASGRGRVCPSRMARSYIILI